MDPCQIQLNRWSRVVKFFSVVVLVLGLASDQSLATAADVDDFVLGLNTGKPTWKFTHRGQYAWRRGYFAAERTQPHFLPELRIPPYAWATLDRVPYSYCRYSSGAKHCTAIIRTDGRVHRFTMWGFGSGEQILDRRKLIAVVGNAAPFTLSYRDADNRLVQLTFPGGVFAQCESKDWRECEAQASAACPSGYSVEKRFERRSHFSPVRTVRDLVATCNEATRR